MGVSAFCQNESNFGGKQKPPYLVYYLKKTIISNEKSNYKCILYLISIGAN